MKRLFKFKYPKIAALLLSIVAAYFFFSNPDVSYFVSHLNSLSYAGAFIGGMLFTFGFTTPFAIGFFLVLEPNNVVIASVVGGLGAMISDVLIFNVIRFSFMDEFNKMKKEKAVRELNLLIKENIRKKIRNYLMYALAGIIIASPLPDEAGISMLAGITRIKQKKLAVISFCIKTTVIFAVLSL